MAEFSYFQQIVNRTSSNSDRYVGELPLLHPTRPLFRQWEVNQPLDFLPNSEVLMEKGNSNPSLLPTLPNFESTLQQPYPLTRREETGNRIEEKFNYAAGLLNVEEQASGSKEQPSWPANLTPIPSASDQELTEVKPFPESVDVIASPLTPKIPSPSELPPQPSLQVSTEEVSVFPSATPTNPFTLNPPEAIPREIQQPFSPAESEDRETTTRQEIAEEISVSTNPPTLKPSQAIPTEIKSSVQQQPDHLPVVEPSREKLEQASGEMPSLPPVLRDLSEIQGNREQGTGNSDWFGEGLLPPANSFPLKSDRSAMFSVVAVPPESKVDPRKTTLKPLPIGPNSPPREQWVELGKESPKKQENTVHIGSIDIQIMSPPIPPPQPVVQSPSSPLSRGFTSSFGLRQG